MSRLLLVFATTVAALHAQSVPVGGPSIGYIFDERGQAMLPILGIPGAAFFGNPLATPSPLTSAALSFHQSVAVANDGAWTALTLSPSGVSSRVLLPVGMAANARVAVSETGSAAAFYDAAGGAMTVLTGITGSSIATTSVSLGALPGAITRFAVADDGSLLLASTMSGGGEGIFRIGSDGSALQLATMQQTASILVWNSGKSALVTDRAANQVWSIQNPGSSAAITLLASDADGVSGPVGAALSADGTNLWIANAGSQSVLGIDLGTRASTSLTCGFDLTTLLPMADPASFQLNRPKKGPMWILDTASGSGSRVVFVPAITVPAVTSASANAGVTQ